jgi:hypothetical protein
MDNTSRHAFHSCSTVATKRGPHFDLLPLCFELFIRFPYFMNRPILKEHHAKKKKLAKAAGQEQTWNHTKQNVPDFTIA